MKRILLIFALAISLFGNAQTQTFTGVKTFTSPPKFQNLIQNDLNTKVLTVNSTGGVQYKNAATFSPNGYFSAGLAGSSSPLSIKIGDYNSQDTGTYYEYKSSAFNFPLANHNFYGSVNIDGYFRFRESGQVFYTQLITPYLTDNLFFTFPNASGTLLTDAPIDGRNYVRKDGAWEVNAGGSGIPLTGTIGNPVTGDIQMSHVFLTNNINSNKKIGFSGGSVILQSDSSMGYEGSFINTTPDFINLFTRDDSKSGGATITIDSFEINFTSLLSRGLIGKYDYTSKITDLDYTQKKYVDNNFLKIRTTAPTSSTDTGVKGEVYTDAYFIYYCYATNSWRKSAGSTF